MTSENRLEKLKEWEEEKPNDAFLKFAIAQEYAGMSNYEEAGKYFQTLVEKFPDYLPTYYQFGKLLELNGLNEKAVDTFLKGIELAQAQKDFKTARELNEALTMLRNE